MKKVKIMNAHDRGLPQQYTQTLVTTNLDDPSVNDVIESLIEINEPDILHHSPQDQEILLPKILSI